MYAQTDVFYRRRQTGQEAAPKLDQSRSLPLSNVSSNNLLFDGEAPEREGEVVLVEESVSGDTFDIFVAATIRLYYFISPCLSAVLLSVCSGPGCFV